MFKTRLYWFASEESDPTKHVSRDHGTESAARGFAAERSAAVAGGCYVTRGESVIAHYKAGEDTLAKVAA